MNTIFTDKGWSQYLEWFKAGDKKAIRKINDLIEDIKKNGLLQGTGQPEQLKYLDEVRYSRRITQGDRLVYFQDEHSNLVITACRGHYDDT